MSILFETVLSGAGYARLHASPLQRAVCRAADGLPIGDDLTDAEVTSYFGCDRSQIGLSFPVLVVLVCGVRAGKSFFSASGAIRDALEADCSGLQPHERPRHAIVAPSVDNATATFRLLLGILQSSPILRSMVVGEPTSDTVVLRRPDGRTVEIVVVAAHRGGMTLRSRWLAGATLDEVALFGVETMGAVVNAEEILRAAEARVLPRTQVRIVSSPMGRQGLLFELYKEHFGKPGRVLVVHAPTRAMNPSFSAEAIEALRRRDADAAAREYDASWIDGETTFLDGTLIDAAMRAAPVERLPQMGASYVCSMDAGTRGNAWTLVIARATAAEEEAIHVEIPTAMEWKGSKTSPLSPAAVFRDIAARLKPYRVSRIHCDAWAFDAMNDHARAVDLSLVQHGSGDRDAAYAALHSTIASSRLELPPNEQLRQDLRGVRKLITPTGFRLDLPRTPDGRHCDFAPSVAMAVWRAITEVERGDTEIYWRRGRRGSICFI